jgi:hypothetical protein
VIEAEFDAEILGNAAILAYDPFQNLTEPSGLSTI